MFNVRPTRHQVHGHQVHAETPSLHRSQRLTPASPPLGLLVGHEAGENGLETQKGGGDEWYC